MRKLQDTVEIVEWADANSVDAWTSEDEIEAFYHTILTIGMVIKESEEILTMGLNFDTTAENWCCIINIPKINILSRKLISEDKNQLEIGI